MEPTDNRREFTRVRVNLLTELRSGETVDIAGSLANVSMSGLFLTCPTRLPIDTVCRLTLMLEGGLDALTIQTEGKVIRNDSDGMALQFTKILGPESLQHLQNLVMYNSGDHIAQVENELSFHVGLYPSEEEF
jgi:PilZ domain